jgi:hypothetical protein
LAAEDHVQRTKALLAGTTALAMELKAAYLTEATRGSRAEQERAQGFVAGRYRSVLEVYTMAETRFVAATSQLEAVAALLDMGPLMVHAICSLARASLESSARAAWLLDPRIDGTVRGLRGVAELLYVFREEAKMPIRPFREMAIKRLKEVQEGTVAAGFRPTLNKKGEILHFGEPRPDATSMVRLIGGEAGEIVYRELSGVAHGNLTAHVRLMERVPKDETHGVTTTEPRVSVTRPASAARLIPALATVWRPYMHALGRKLVMYGWDRARFAEWAHQAGKEWQELVNAQVGEPGESR